MAAKTTDLERASYVPIDPKKLTPHQRQLWDTCKMNEPPPAGLTQQNMDEQFRYACQLDGDPIPE